MCQIVFGLLFYWVRFDFCPNVLIKHQKCPDCVSCDMFDSNGDSSIVAHKGNHFVNEPQKCTLWQLVVIVCVAFHPGFLLPRLNNSCLRLLQNTNQSLHCCCVYQGSPSVILNGFNESECWVCIGYCVTSERPFLCQYNCADFIVFCFFPALILLFVDATYFEVN